MKITVEKPDAGQIAEMENWPVWQKEESTFDWHYDEPEICYLTDGEVTVKTADGEAVDFAAGDLVTFPQGLSCVWNIRKAVRKHYRFG